jgi:hypothetical protein
MKGTHVIHGHPSPDAAPRDTHEPIPARHPGRRSSEDVYSEREPWLPLQEFYPDLPRPLKKMATAVLVLVIASIAFIMLAMLRV